MNDVKSAITVTNAIVFVIADIIEKNMEGEIGVDCLEPLCPARLERTKPSDTPRPKRKRRPKAPSDCFR